MARGKRQAVKNTENRAKRARGETDLKWDLAWNEAGPVLVPSSTVLPLLYLSSPTLEGATKVAGFDIDSTIIKTKSGRTFATGANDWMFLYECVPDKLRDLHAEGYRVVFFTNQAGIEKCKVTPDTIKVKVEAIIQELEIPVYTFVSTGTNHFRKPSTVMWDYLEQHCNQGVEVDRSASVYVGDAAGRAKGWQDGKPKDFSCGDRMFAANVGVEFHTPEAFFLGEKEAPFEWRSVDPATILKDPPAENPTKEAIHSESQEMVLMVGQPASGKSTFCKRHLIPHGYVHVNRDTMKTPAKCLKVAQQAIDEGKSVVIDNTNPAPQARSEYIRMAKRAGIPCRCFHMQTPLNVSHHLNLLRMRCTEGEIRRIPDVAYNMYKSGYAPPQASEGFTEVKNVAFTPSFKNDKDKELFLQWTC